MPAYSHFFNQIILMKMPLQTQTLQSCLLVTAGLAIATIPAPSGADEPLTRARQMYPIIIADLERQCPSPSTLDARTFTASTGLEMVSFTCWSAVNESGYRTGKGLGQLPVSPTESFGQPLTCKAGDELCDRWQPTLQAQYPIALAQAEFQCAMRNGTLFTQFAEDSVTVRCGFLATTLYDENDDNRPDYEDQISVDIPVTTLPLVE